MSETRKVLHIFGILNRGGAEMRTLSLIDDMQKLGKYFDFCVLSGKPGVLDELAREKGCKIHYCPLGPLFIFRFIALLKRERYDIVHSHVSLVSGFILFLAKLAGVPVRIAHFRNTMDVASPGRLRIWRDKILKTMLLRSANKILAVCEAAFDLKWSSEWRHNDRFKVVYNGFELPELECQQAFWASHIASFSPHPIVLHVGRMDEPKNHPRLIKMFARYHQLYGPAYMVFVGREQQDVKQQLLTYIEQANLGPWVYFVGEQKDVLPFMANANVLLFPSKWEGLPGVVIEASSVGLPVLGSDIPGICEIARYLSNVEIESLSNSDEVWAARLNDVIHKEYSPEGIRREFTNSPFLLSQNIEHLNGIYQ